MINIDSSTINSVLFGLIIAVVIILLINMFKKNDSKENLTYKSEGEMNKNRFDDIMNARPKCALSDTSSSGSLDVKSNDTNEIMPKQNEDPKTLITPPKRFCDLNVLESKDDTLRRDIVLGRKLQQGEKQQTFDDMEIREYQNQVLRAEDNLNYSSRNTICSNDKLNEIFTSQNNELTNEKGQTIADVFDGLTKNELREMAQCKNPGCIIPSSYDELQQRKIYMDNENTMMPAFLNYNTRYETDGVNNGGKFGDIYGHDETLSSYLAISTN